jgi:hypothetical protein
MVFVKIAIPTIWACSDGQRCSLFTSNASAEVPVKITKLRCEYLDNPLGIDVAQPEEVQRRWASTGNRRLGRPLNRGVLMVLAAMSRHLNRPRELNNEGIRT